MRIRACITVQEGSTQLMRMFEEGTTALGYTAIFFVSVASNPVFDVH